MNITQVSLRNELNRRRKAPADVLDQVRQIFENEEKREAEILRRLTQKAAAEDLPLELHEEDKKNLYHVDHIRDLCIQYRLRFLPSSVYKKDFPAEALHKIKAFESRYGYKTAAFSMVAPEAVFSLSDINADPMLFADLGNGYYYLLHTWGRDMSRMRSILCYPLRSIYHFTLSVFIAALIFSFSFPFSIMGFHDKFEFSVRCWFALHCMIAFFGFGIFIGSTTQQMFSDSSWNSKHFNS
ncbi:MAG: hypothetical protein ACK5JC_07100 [Bacteroidota bacterium]|jgi:hypothetical protein